MTNPLRSIANFLVLPSEISDFERSYLKRVNRAALVFFALHAPVFALVAYFNQTSPALAFLASLSVLLGPVLARFALKSPRSLSIVHGITAMLMGGLLVHFGQGPVQIEMHFYFFALIAMCAVFGNPLVIVAAAAIVALHHLVIWLVLPRSVFNYEAEWWVVAVHALFVVLESVATCFIARSFFDNVIGLEKIVRNRTTELDAKNQAMRLLLDNVQQGFLTIDRSGSLARERSAVVDRWFGTPPAGATWFDYLATTSPTFADATRFAWGEVKDAILPLALTLEQMPRALAHGGSSYRFEYRPIGAGEEPEHFLVIVTDVTTELEREAAELERNETMALFERVLADRAGVETFIEEATNIVDVLVHQRSNEPSTVKRLIHTLKGNAASYGLASVAARCHELEDFIAETGTLPATLAYAELAQRWKRVATDIEKLLGKRASAIEVDWEQYRALERAVRSGETGSRLLRRVRGLRLESTAKRLAHFAEQAQRIAARLDKSEVRIEVQDHGVRLDHNRWSAFWSAFIHAIRNALDHGVEGTEERASSGKTTTPLVALRTFEQNESMIVEISDDGRGIDWHHIAERARSAGLAATTASDLERALFVDGISTATNVSDVSGRGIGMGALLAATEALGGKLSIESELRRGTTVRFTFPLQTAEPGESAHAMPAVQP